ncbi:hypothetical protein BwiPL1_53270 (plasmid) [Bacillus wiedmannii]|nr:hypothetical protein BwiPL1_53270 [Bacillus wiedmannii]
MHYIHKVWKLKRNKYRKFSSAIQLKRICGKNRNDNWGTAEIRVKIGYSDTFFTKFIFT